MKRSGTTVSRQMFYLLANVTSSFMLITRKWTWPRWVWLQFASKGANATLWFPGLTESCPSAAIAKFIFNTKFKDISPRCVRCSSAETGPFFQSTTENTFSWSFSINKLEHVNFSKPTQHSGLCKLQLYLNLVETVHLDKWKVANVTAGFLSWVPGVVVTGCLVQDISFTFFAFVFFSFCCCEISHLARADR